MLNYQRELVTDTRKTKGLVINHLIEKDTPTGDVSSLQRYGCL
jgi:hypothetical protein